MFLKLQNYLDALHPLKLSEYDTRIVKREFVNGGEGFLTLKAHFDDDAVFLFEFEMNVPRLGGPSTFAPASIICVATLITPPQDNPYHLMKGQYSYNKSDTFLMVNLGHSLG
jgi:hypothetical protein